MGRGEGRKGGRKMKVKEGAKGVELASSLL